MQLLAGPLQLLVQPRNRGFLPGVYSRKNKPSTSWECSEFWILFLNMKVHVSVCL